MKGRNNKTYPKTEAAMRRADAAWDKAQTCTHPHSKLVTTDDEVTYKDTLIDGEVIEICANSKCGKTLGWPV